RPRRVGVGLVPRLSLPDEDGFHCRIPQSLDRRGTCVVAARDETQTAILHVRNEAVAEQVPADSEPHSGKIEIGVIEARGIVVNYGSQGVVLLVFLKKNRRCVIAHTGGGAFGGLFQGAVVDDRVVVVRTEWEACTRSACRWRCTDWRG